MKTEIPTIPVDKNVKCCTSSCWIILSSVNDSRHATNSES